MEIRLTNTDALITFYFCFFNREFEDDILALKGLFDCRLRGVLFIVRAGNDIIKADFMHTKRTNLLTKMKIGIHLEELK